VGRQRWCFRRAKKAPPAVLFLELLAVFGDSRSDSRKEVKVRRVLFPVPIVAHDVINRACANFVTNGTQFSAMGKDSILKQSHFIVVPFSVGVSCLYGLPLAHRKKQ
jgi:hypothetical protein